jgi:hypothetical protein
VKEKKEKLATAPSYILDLLPEVKTKIEKIMNWDFSQIRKYILRHEKIDAEDLDQRILEYKRFISLHLISEKRMPISEKVDLVWHTHILFTKDYVKMGQEIFGFYFHHEPTVSDGEKEALAPHFSDTLGAYEKLFGQPSRTYWPVKGQICWSPCNSSTESRAGVAQTQYSTVGETVD